MVTSLGDLLDEMDGPDARLALDDDTFLIGLRHEEKWSIGFRLRWHGGRGQWVMADLLVRCDGDEGATAEQVRRLPLGGLLDRARGMAVIAPRAGSPFVKLDKLNLAPFLTSGHHGLRRTDRDYALLALEYVFLIEDGDPSPAKTLSEKHGHGSPSVWANRIRDARRRGLLTPTKRGQPGGQLTAKAAEVLGLDVK
jgi:hypothetical protein